ncbi:MAG: hypothetical protein P8Q48_01700 [Paracoccaceae bacterium]|nr:hypothetical protein [Paracoccaceae bacterium]MDG1368958.1 hypothetical protein [Paracoccaceae bacterium]
MSKRFNITVVTTFQDRDGKDRKNYTRCGTAFLNPTQNGPEVINLKFDFIPTAAPGQMMEIACFEPKAKEEDDGVVD